MKLIFIFLLSFSVEKITINKAKNYGCNLLAINELYIEAQTDDNIDDMSFEFKVKGNKNYNIKCSLLGIENQNQNATEPDDFYPFNTDYYSEEYTELNTNNIGRLLDEISKTIGSCQIEGVDKNETFHRNNITDISLREIEFNDNFTFDVISCTKKEDKIDSKLIISFRQLNGYQLIKDKQKIIFLFYGMVSKDLPKGHIIKMDVNLIKDNFEEDKPRTATCILKKGIVIKGDEPIQGDFNCTIEDLEKEEIININSFVLKQSQYFSGIPEDNVLLNPVLTQKYINLGKLIDYSVDKNKEEKVPSFNSTLIDDSNCNINGTFIINGILTSDLNNALKFDLPIAYPENLTATCSINSGKKNETINITCKTNGEINNQNIMISQNTILDNNKKELLIISKIEAQKESQCNNAKTQIINDKLNNNIKISFRQVNQFYPMNKRTNFHFIGISDQSLSSEKTLKILVAIIFNGTKIEKEANCTLNSFSSLNALNPNYGQANFICEVKHDEFDKIEDLEVISSDEILGLNDDLEDNQKSPYITDKMIKETINEPSLGQVLNFSSTTDFYDIPPTFEISSINFDKCESKGKIKVNGKFNQKIDQKFDFTIPLSYPSSSIKCTAPNIDANRNVDIDCKIQKDFYNAEQIIIEPRIIKKKHREVIFIKNYTYNKKKQTCKNYNTLQKTIEANKTKNNYSFLQTNNFIPTPSGLFFRILIYSLQNDFPKTIPIIISIRRRISNLRNLQDIQEEDEIECLPEDKNISPEIKGYNCNSTIKAKDASDFEDFSFESDVVPGIYEENSNPILTDNNIKSGIVPQITKDYKIGSFDDTKIEDKNCNVSGIFYISGNLNNKELAKLKPFEIHYSNPPDSYSLCNFTSYELMECNNAEAFEDEFIVINKQTLANGMLYFPGVTSNDIFTCAISSSSSLSLETPVGNNTEIVNSYFNKKRSSSGLSGGAIAAIVIISAAVLVGIGILISIIKNGILFSKKPEISNSYIPPISNSSANII